MILFVAGFFALSVLSYIVAVNFTSNSQHLAIIAGVFGFIGGSIAACVKKLQIYILSAGFTVSFLMVLNVLTSGQIFKNRMIGLVVTCAVLAIGAFVAYRVNRLIVVVATSLIGSVFLVDGVDRLIGGEKRLGFGLGVSYYYSCTVECYILMGALVALFLLFFVFQYNEGFCEMLRRKSSSSSSHNNNNNNSDEKGKRYSMKHMESKRQSSKYEPLLK